MKAAHMAKLERTEMRMIRWMAGVSLRERNTNAELRGRIGVEGIGEVVRRNRLMWFGHVQRKAEARRRHGRMRSRMTWGVWVLPPKMPKIGAGGGGLLGGNRPTWVHPDKSR